MSDEIVEEPQISVSVDAEGPVYVASVSIDESKTGIQLQIWETQDNRFVVVAAQLDEMIPVDLVDSLEEGISRIRTVLESLGAEQESD